jgi:hypothetical protein
MALAHGPRQAVEQELMLAQHLDQRVLDQLPSRPGGQERRAFRLPGRLDRLPARYGLRIAALGVGKKISSHEIKRLKLSFVEVGRGRFALETRRRGALPLCSRCTIDRARRRLQA